MTLYFMTLYSSTIQINRIAKNMKGLSFILTLILITRYSLFHSIITINFYRLFLIIKVLIFTLNNT